MDRDKDVHRLNLLDVDSMPYQVLVHLVQVCINAVDLESGLLFEATRKIETLFF